MPARSPVRIAVTTQRRIPAAIDRIQADLNAPLPCPDASFDTIIATEVIEHLENPRAAFRELSRLVRPGGRLLLDDAESGEHSLACLADCPRPPCGVPRRELSGASHRARSSRSGAALSGGGLRSASIAYTDFGAVPKWTSVTWQSVSLGLLRGRLFSDNLVLWWPREPDSPPRGSRRARNGREVCRRAT